MLESFFLYLLGTGITGSLFILLILLLKPFSKRVFSQTWHYGTQKAALIFLIMPLSLLFIQYIKLPKIISPIPVYFDSVTQTQSQTFHDNPVQSNEVLPENPNLINDLLSDSALITKALEATPFLWALGFTIFFLVRLGAYVRVIPGLSLGSTAPGKTEIIHVFEQVKKELGIRRKIRLLENDRMITPMLAGLFRPAVFIPRIELTYEQWRFIFLHELTHFKRRDLLWKTVATVVNSIHWFNPLVYWLCANINKACETSCDEEVLKRVDSKDKKHYGMTILEVLDFSVGKKQAIYSAFFVSKNNLKSRLKSIASFKKAPFYITTVSILISLLAGSFSVLTTAAIIPDINNEQINLSIKISSSLWTFEPYTAMEDPQPVKNPEDNVIEDRLYLDNGSVIDIAFDAIWLVADKNILTKLTAVFNNKDWSDFSVENTHFTVYEYGYKEKEAKQTNAEYNKALSDFVSAMNEKIRTGQLKPYAPSCYRISEGFPDILSDLDHITIFEIDNTSDNQNTQQLFFAFGYITSNCETYLYTKP